MTAEHSEDLAEGTLLSHLVELRSRLFKIFGAVFLVFIALLPFSKSIFNYVAEPLVSVVPEGELIALSPVSPLTATIALTFYIALFLAMPVILYQVWAFVAPGLYRTEKRFTFPLLATSIVLFFVGMAFAYFVVFPLVFQFLTGLNLVGVTMATDINNYLNFVIKMFFAFGLAFEIPVATLLIVWSGISSADAMAAKRPYIIVGCFVLGMLLTPPDVLSQLLLAIPAWGLFEIGILLSRLVEKRKDEVM